MAVQNNQWEPIKSSNQHEPPSDDVSVPPSPRQEIEGECEVEEFSIVWDSLELEEFPVNIAGENYLLVEASAEDAKAWRANNLQSLHMREKGTGKNRETLNTFNATLADSELLLVSLCLYKVGNNGSRQRVTLDTLRKWPNKLIEKLFNKAQKMSGLKEEEDKKEGPGKNSNSGARLPAP